MIFFKNSNTREISEMWKIADNSIDMKKNAHYKKYLN